MDYFLADTKQATDYHPFGMAMPGRTFANSALGYLYGFNGQEKTPEVNNSDYDFVERMYDARIGRFLSVDGLSQKYPWYTPYQFAGNKPIWAIDLDGLEEYIKIYKYEDGKATLLRVVKNSEVQLKSTSNSEKNGQTPFTKEIIDKRTGKPMNPSEIGQVQHQYVDAKGNRLNIRRDYDGNFVKGANEMMSVGDNNLLGSIYIGPTNPTYKDINGKDKPDYRREPQDEVDAAAMQHDKDYDSKQAAGAGDAFFNQETIPADKKLVAAATATVQKAKTGGLDNTTGKPVSDDTKRRANIVRKFFGYLLKSETFKGTPPNGPGTGTHVIK